VNNKPIEKGNREALIKRRNLRKKYKTVEDLMDYVEGLERRIKRLETGAVVNGTKLE
jgi:hypothetical protein